jgi:WD40 repeat protein
VFSPDGRRIATASIDRTARIWDSHTGQALTPPLRHDSAVEEVYFSADGQRVWTAALGRVFRVWDAHTGRPLTEWLTIKGALGVSFDPIHGRIVTGTTNGIAHIWTIPEAPLPVPEWFPKFAEALAGVRLGDQGHAELVGGEELSKLARKISVRESKDFYARLAQRLGPSQTDRE